MNPVPADELLPDELAALMYFYGEAGVMWLSEDEAVDRFAEFAASPAGQARAPRVDAPQAERRERPASAPAAIAAPQVAVPDAEAIEAARNLASSASTGEVLIAAVEAFAGCNLKFSARHTVFAAGNLAARVLVLGGVPVAEDDREGRPFAGASGRMLDRMAGGAGIDPAELLLVNMIPWRTPGDRAPTVREVEICTPFAQRLIELVRPQAVLVLGNLPARVFSGGARASIHGIRGKWFDIAAGAGQFRAFATFHPEELVTTPSCKRLAWQDMLRFRAELGG